MDDVLNQILTASSLSGQSPYVEGFVWAFSGGGGMAEDGVYYCKDWTYDGSGEVENVSYVMATGNHNAVFSQGSSAIDTSDPKSWTSQGCTWDPNLHEGRSLCSESAAIYCFQQ